MSYLVLIMPYILNYEMPEVLSRFQKMTERVFFRNKALIYVRRNNAIAKYVEI